MFKLKKLCINPSARFFYLQAHDENVERLRLQPVPKRLKLGGQDWQLVGRIQAFSAIGDHFKSRVYKHTDMGIVPGWYSFSDLEGQAVHTADAVSFMEYAYGSLCVRRSERYLRTL